MDKKYREMKEITQKDYLDFIKDSDTVIIEDVKIKLQKNWKIKYKFMQLNKNFEYIFKGLFNLLDLEVVV